MIGLLLWKLPEKRGRSLRVGERSILHMRFTCAEITRGPKTPEAVLRRSDRRVIARRLSPELQRTVGVVYKQKTGLSTAGQMFLSELKASIPNVRG